MKQKVSITPFLDDAGRVTQLPGKHKTRLAVLRYLAGKFELKCIYSEQQINGICGQWHTFGDNFLLRRELVDHRMLDRERDGSKYWRIWDDISTTDECDQVE